MMEHGQIARCGPRASETPVPSEAEADLSAAVAVSDFASLWPPRLLQDDDALGSPCICPATTTPNQLCCACVRLLGWELERETFWLSTPAGEDVHGQRRIGLVTRGTDGFPWFPISSRIICRVKSRLFGSGWRQFHPLRSILQSSCGRLCIDIVSRPCVCLSAREDSGFSIVLAKDAASSHSSPSTLNARVSATGG